MSGDKVSKNRWYLDVGLMIIVAGLAVLVYTRLDSLFDSRRDPEPTAVTGDLLLAETEDLQSQNPEPVIIALGQAPAEDFSLPDISGEIISLSDYQGKAVLINFWATWCPPCLTEMPLFQAYADKYPESLIVIAVNAGEGEESVRAFVEHYGYDMVFLVDVETTVSKLYQVRGLPTSLFIDPDGQLVATHIGKLDESLLSTYLQKIGIE